MHGVSLWERHADLTASRPVCRLEPEDIRQTIVLAVAIAASAQTLRADKSAGGHPFRTSPEQGGGATVTDDVQRALDSQKTRYGTTRWEIALWCGLALVIVRGIVAGLISSAGG